MSTSKKGELPAGIRDKLFILVFAVFLLGGGCNTPTIEPGIDRTTPAITEETVSQSTPTHQEPSPTASEETYTPVPTTESENTGIPLEQDQLLPEIPPHNIGVFLESNDVELRWRGTGSDIAVHYNIYRRTISTEKWDEIGRISVEGDNRGEYVFIDSTVEDPLTVEYAVSTVNIYENESDLSEPAALESNP